MVCDSGGETTYVDPTLLLSQPQQTLLSTQRTGRSFGLGGKTATLTSLSALSVLSKVSTTFVGNITTKSSMADAVHVAGDGGDEQKTVNVNVNEDWNRNVNGDINTNIAHEEVYGGETLWSGGFETGIDMESIIGRLKNSLDRKPSDEGGTYSSSSVPAPNQSHSQCFRQGDTLLKNETAHLTLGEGDLDSPSPSLPLTSTKSQTWTQTAAESAFSFNSASMVSSSGSDLFTHAIRQQNKGKVNQRPFKFFQNSFYIFTPFIRLISYRQNQ